MRQSSATLLGAVLGVVMLGAAFVAPGLFPTKTPAMNPSAQRLAETAQRELAAYNEGVSRLRARQDVEALKAADPEKLYARVKDDVDTQAQMMSQVIDRARKSDRTSGLQAISIAGGSGADLIRKGVQDLQKMAGDNEDRLKAAIKAASDADQFGPSLGVGQALGMAKAVEANKHLSEARRLRTQLNDMRVEAIEKATEWAITRTQLDHFNGLDAKPVDEALREDAAEFERLLSESNADLEELNQTLGERKSALDGVKAGLASVRAEISNIEQQGFQPGNDASYLGMKSSFEAASRRLSDLQEQEQYLTTGGLKGVKFEDDEFATAKMEGGEEYLGIEELERRKTVAEDRVGRLTRGKEAIARKIEGVAAFGAIAADEAKRLAELQTRQQAGVNKVVEAMGDLHKQAIEREDAALGSARAAMQGYAKSKSATQTWLSAINEQKNMDADGRNERLRMISADPYTKQFPDIAQAEGNALMGRIYAERVLGVESYQDTLERLTKVIKGATYDVASIKEQLDTARTEAINALANANETYKGLASDSKFGWMSQLALASVSLTAAKIDASKSDELTAQAKKAIADASAKAGKFWSFNAHFQMLQKMFPSEAPPAEAKPDGESTEKPTDGDGSAP